jgi:hypothetical protein
MGEETETAAWRRQRAAAAEANQNIVNQQLEQLRATDESISIDGRCGGKRIAATEANRCWAMLGVDGQDRL